MFLFRSIFLSATVAFIFIANLAVYVAAAPQFLPFHFVMAEIPSSAVASSAASPTLPVAVPGVVNVDPSAASASASSIPSAAAESPPSQTNSAFSMFAGPGVLLSTAVAGIYLIF
ncbi:hypothetical protein OBBRIDRAFT_795998 [Obba rivulosa]|uniref:Transmembrane protein n=1 Tax=Obba rivulosa TaxID=1052685 RepID=A0A8E2ASR8_9APHY|nr:hypothetical protein OBBRIDRAFT_795998 [Obba rivulosa]